MAEKSAVRLRPATRADWDLIRGWLARPDIQDWWGPVSATEAEVNMALSSQHALCRIIEAGGRGRRLRARRRRHAVGRGPAPGPGARHLGSRSLHRVGGAPRQGRRPGRAGAAQGRGVRLDAGGRGLRLPLGQERARRARLREGGLPLEAHLERPARRAVLVHGRRAAAAVTAASARGRGGGHVPVIGNARFAAAAAFIVLGGQRP